MADLMETRKALAAARLARKKLTLEKGPGGEGVLIGSSPLNELQEAKSKGQVVLHGGSGQVPPSTLPSLSLGDNDTGMGVGNEESNVAGGPQNALESARSGGPSMTRRGFLNTLRGGAMVASGVTGKGVTGALVRGLSEYAGEKGVEAVAKAVAKAGVKKVVLTPVEARVLQHFRTLNLDDMADLHHNGNSIKGYDAPEVDEEEQEKEYEQLMRLNEKDEPKGGENELDKEHYDFLKDILSPENMEENEGYAGSDDDLPEGVKDWEEYQEIVNNLQEKFGHKIGDDPKGY